MALLPSSCQGAAAGLWRAKPPGAGVLHLAGCTTTALWGAQGRPAGSALRPAAIDGGVASSFFPCSS